MTMKKLGVFVYMAFNVLILVDGESTLSTGNQNRRTTVSLSTRQKFTAKSTSDDETARQSQSSNQYTNSPHDLIDDRHAMNNLSSSTRKKFSTISAPENGSPRQIQDKSSSQSVIDDKEKTKIFLSSSSRQNLITKSVSEDGTLRRIESTTQYISAQSRSNAKEKTAIVNKVQSKSKSKKNTERVTMNNLFLNSTHSNEDLTTSIDVSPNIHQLTPALSKSVTLDTKIQKKINSGAVKSTRIPLNSNRSKASTAGLLDDVKNSTNTAGLSNSNRTITTTPGLLENNGSSASTPELLSNNGSSTSTPGLLNNNGSITSTPGLLNSNGTSTSTPGLLNSNGSITSTPGLLHNNGSSTSTPGLLHSDRNITSTLALSKVASSKSKERNVDLLNNTKMTIKMNTSMGGLREGSESIITTTEKINGYSQTLLHAFNNMTTIGTRIEPSGTSRTASNITLIKTQRTISAGNGSSIIHQIKPSRSNVSSVMNTETHTRENLTGRVLHTKPMSTPHLTTKSSSISTVSSKVNFKNTTTQVNNITISESNPRGYNTIVSNKTVKTIATQEGSISPSNVAQIETTTIIEGNGTSLNQNQTTRSTSVSTQQNVKQKSKVNNKVILDNRPTWIIVVFSILGLLVIVIIANGVCLCVKRGRLTEITNQGYSLVDTKDMKYL